MEQKDISKVLSIWKQRRANRKYKDRLFRKIFKNKKDLLQLYNVYIQEHELDVYGSRLTKLPTPQYIVFYNGDEDMPDRMVMKLSDAFMLSEKEMEYVPALECNAVMLNINYGHIEELLNNCRKLKEYSIFVETVKRHLKKEDSVDIAIDKAIDECIAMDVLKDILLK